MRFDLVRQRLWLVKACQRQAAASFSGDCGNPSSRWKSTNWVNWISSWAPASVSATATDPASVPVLFSAQALQQLLSPGGGAGWVQSGCQLISFGDLLLSILLTFIYIFWVSFLSRSFFGKKSGLCDEVYDMWDGMIIYGCVLKLSEVRKMP